MAEERSRGRGRGRGGARRGAVRGPAEERSPRPPSRSSRGSGGGAGRGPAEELLAQEAPEEELVVTDEEPAEELVAGETAATEAAAPPEEADGARRRLTAEGPARARPSASPSAAGSARASRRRLRRSHRAARRCSRATPWCTPSTRSRRWSPPSGGASARTSSRRRAPSTVRLLGSRAFAEEGGVAFLEELLFPRIEAPPQDWIAHQRSLRPPPPLLVCEVPLLFEAGAERAFDASLVVTAPEARPPRAGSRRAARTSPGAAARQLPEEEKVSRADRAYVNDGDLDDAAGLGRRPVRGVR